MGILDSLGNSYKFFMTDIFGRSRIQYQDLTVLGLLAQFNRN
jgi:hypothetical protein